MLIGTIDIVVFLAYILAVVAVGFWVGRGRQASSEDYFLAGRSIPWYAVGASFIGSNISTEHFIGMIGAAYLYGICIANWEWLNVWTFSVLIWIFIPFLLATRVFSAPEFLERRFNGACRLLFAIVTVLASIFAFLAAVLYAGAIGVDAIFDIQGLLVRHLNASPERAPLLATILCVLVIGITTGSYAIFGGLSSVVWTDVFQVAIMFLGGVLVTILGLAALGESNPLAGWSAMLAANATPTADGYNRLSLFQPIGHPVIAWPNILLLWLSVGVWYNCINQFMIQRVLAARDGWHARMGIVFAGFMKILLPFLIVIPGLLMFAMDPGLPKPDKSYPILVQTLIPAGLKGLILAALFGAVQSTISAVLNSTSTVITLDIYDRFVHRQPAPAMVSVGPGTCEAIETPHSRIETPSGATARAGVLISTAVLIVAMVIAPLISLLDAGVFIYIQNLYAHFAPPFSAVFITGMLWKRANAQGAMASIVAGLVLSVAISLAPAWGWIAPVQPFLVRATAVFFCCVGLMVVVSLVTSPPPPEKVTDQTTLNWRRLNLFDDLGDRWYKSVVLWWAVFVLSIAACYLAYSGLF